MDGSVAEYLRPDERSLGTLVKKALATPRAGPAFAVTKHGLAVADGGLDAVLADLGSATHYVLDQGAADVRTCPLDVRNGAFFVGDHLGFGETIRMHLATVGATPIGIGPVSVHAEDAIAVVANEVDRRTQASRLSSAP